MFSLWATGAGSGSSYSCFCSTGWEDGGTGADPDPSDTFWLPISTFTYNLSYSPVSSFLGSFGSCAAISWTELGWGWSSWGWAWDWGAFSSVWLILTIIFPKTLHLKAENNPNGWKPFSQILWAQVQSFEGNNGQIF